MRAALERAAGRLLTGPAAFLVAGLIDLGTFAGYALRHWLLTRLGRRQRI